MTDRDRLEAIEEMLLQHATKIDQLRNMQAYDRSTVRWLIGILIFIAISVFLVGAAR